MKEEAVIEVSDPKVMTKSPVVTVMITTYNQEDYVVDAIDGVLQQQTDFPFELIIGEDCSTDQTRDIVLDYQRKYPELIRVVYGVENVGAFSNSNRCFDRVRGEFVAYCEGDDYWHDPRKLQKQVDYLRAHPKCGLVHSDYDSLVYNFGKWRLIRAKLRPKRLAAIKNGRIYDHLLRKMLVRTCTMMGRTELLKKHYHSELRNPVHAVGDRPIVLHMSKLANVDYLDESLATYRRTPGSMTNVGHIKLLSQISRKVDMYRNFFLEFGADESEWLDMQRICFRENLNAAFLARNEREFSSALDWLRKNDSAFAGTFRVRLMKGFMHFPFLVTLLIKIKHLFNETRLFWLSSKHGSR